MASELSLAFQIEMFLDRNFDRTFKTVDNTLTQAAEKMKRLGEQSKNYSGLADMAGKCQVLAQKGQELQERLGSTQTRLEYVSRSLEQNRMQTAMLTSHYARMKEEANRLASSGQKNTTVYQRVTKRMEELKTRIKGSTDEGKRLSALQKELTSESSALQKQIESGNAALSDMGQKLTEAGVNTKDLAQEQARLTEQSQRAEQAGQRLASAQAKLADIRSKLSWNNIKTDIINSAKGLAVFQKPIAIDMDFEQAMAQVKAVTGITGEEFEKMRNQAMELGASTQFSATQAANTQEALARAGMKSGQVMAVIPSVLSMAAADGMDLAQAGSILADTLGGMGVEVEKLTAEEAKRYADVLANSSSLGNTNIAEIGEAMKIAAPIAGSQGITIEQLGGYLASMANKGLKGSNAGQAIVGGLNRLALNPKETSDALRTLGVATKTQTGQMRELPDIMKEINKAFKDRKFGDAEQLKYMDKIFGQNYGKSMMGFMAASASGDVDKNVRSNEVDARAGLGRAGEMAAVRNNTLKGDITALGSAWEGLNIQIGHALELPARYITQTLTEGISRITAFTREHETLCTWVVRIAAGFASMKVVSTVYKYGSLLVQLPFAKLSTLLAQAGVEAVAAGKNFSVLSTIFGAFTSPLSAVGNAFKSLWGIIAAHPFMALFVAIELIYHNWDTLKDLGVKCAEKLSEVWQKVKDWWEAWTLPDIFNPLIEKANAAFDYLAAPFIKLKDYIIDLFANFNPFNWELPSWLGGSKNMTPEQVKSRDTARHDRAVDAMNMAFGAPSLGGYAVGGIVRTHEIAHIAESGAEAVIPLTNRSRGLEVLHQAADILGVDITPIQGQGTSSVMNMLNGQSSIMNTIRSNTTQGTILHDLAGDYSVMNTLGGDAFTSHETLQEVRNFTDDLYSGRNYDSYNNLSRSYVDNRQPQINITVNASGQDNNESLANQIANAVREAWYELQERQERLAYA